MCAGKHEAGAESLRETMKSQEDEGEENEAARRKSYERKGKRNIKKAKENSDQARRAKLVL